MHADAFLMDTKKAELFVCGQESKNPQWESRLTASVARVNVINRSGLRPFPPERLNLC